MIINSDDPLYNRRMTKAGSNLVVTLPFFGYVLFGSSVKVEPRDIKTMATDGVKIFCGRKFVETEDTEVVMFGLLHELLHIYFNHHGRRGSRVPRLWNIAADMYVNDQCSVLLGSTDSSGNLVRWAVPKRFIQCPPWAHDKTIEEIYEVLVKQQQADPSTIKKYLPEPPPPSSDNGPVSTTGDGTSPPVSEGEDEISSGYDMVEPEEEPVPTEDGQVGPQVNRDWQENFRQDIAHAKALAERSPLHKPLSTTVQSRMDKILRPTLPWGSLVRGGLSTDLGWDEQTYAPPKMKYYPIIIPQTRQTKERILLLGVDVSASVTQELIRIFITNTQAAAQRATKTVIVTFDEIVREVYETTHPRHIFDHVKFNSGHHRFTSALGVFEIAQKVKPSAICILTDGYIELPSKPFKKTTFVIPEGGKKAPWGTSYVMEYPW